MFAPLLFALALLHNSIAQQSIGCQESYTAGSNQRLLALEVLSNTDLIVVTYNAISSAVSTQILNSTNGAAKSNILSIGNPKNVDLLNGHPHYLISVLPNSTYSISMTFNALSGDPSPSIMQILCAYNSTKIYSLTTWFISYQNMIDANYYNPIIISALNNYTFIDLWMHRTMIKPGTYRNIVEFTVLNASNGASFISNGSIPQTSTTEMDDFEIGTCYDKNSNTNRWTVLYRPGDSADYYQNFGIVYQMTEGRIEPITKLIGLDKQQFSSAGLLAPCKSLYHNESMVICFPYAQVECALYDEETLDMIGDRYTLHLKWGWDPDFGDWTLLIHDEQHYLIMCTLAFTDNLACSLVDVDNNFKVILDDIPVFFVKCCNWDIAMNTLTNDSFVITATNGDLKTDATDIYFCQATF